MPPAPCGGARRIAGVHRTKLFDRLQGRRLGRNLFTAVVRCGESEGFFTNSLRNAHKLSLRYAKLRLYRDIFDDRAPFTWFKEVDAYLLWLKQVNLIEVQLTCNFGTGACSEDMVAYLVQYG